MNMSGFQFDFQKAFEETDPIIKQKNKDEFESIISKLKSSRTLGDIIEETTVITRYFDSIYNTIWIEVLNKYHKELMIYLNKKFQGD